MAYGKTYDVPSRKEKLLHFSTTDHTGTLLCEMDDDDDVTDDDRGGWKVRGDRYQIQSLWTADVHSSHQNGGEGDTLLFRVVMSSRRST